VAPPTASMTLVAGLRWRSASMACLSVGPSYEKLSPVPARFRWPPYYAVRCKSSFGLAALLAGGGAAYAAAGLGERDQGDVGVGRQLG
jgi:hypothetical protein